MPADRAPHDEPDDLEAAAERMAGLSAAARAAGRDLAAIREGAARGTAGLLRLGQAIDAMRASLRLPGPGAPPAGDRDADPEAHAPRPAGGGIDPRQAPQAGAGGRDADLRAG